MKAEVDVDCKNRIPVILIQNQTQRDHGAVWKSKDKFNKIIGD